MKFNPKGEGEIFILGKVNILMSFNKEGKRKLKRKSNLK
jgi:hypothetical protein